MSSLTMSITVWREAQPCSAIEGLNTRTFVWRRLARRAELPVRQQRAEQIVDCARGQVIGVELAKILAPEAFDQRPLLGADACSSKRQHRVDAFAPLRVR